jgi:hypothetical protein
MNRRTLIAVMLVLATSVSTASEPPGRWHWPWRWFWHIGQDGDQPYEPPADQEVTDNAGAKSLLFRSYDNGKIWTTTGFAEWADDDLMTGFEYDDFRHSVGQVTIADEGDVEAGGVCMASTDGSKFAAWCRNEPPDDGEVVVASQDLHNSDNSGDIIKDYPSMSAGWCFHGPCGPGFCGLRLRPAVCSRRAMNWLSPSGRPVRLCRRSAFSSAAVGS